MRAVRPTIASRPRPVRVQKSAVGEGDDRRRPARVGVAQHERRLARQVEERREVRIVRQGRVTAPQLRPLPGSSGRPARIRPSATAGTLAAPA